MNRSVVVFDNVVVRSDSGTRRLSIDAFLELPLNERIVHILQRRVEFFAGATPVERDLALRSLRLATAARA